MIFSNAEKAFDYYYRYINKYGFKVNNTKTIINTGFYINNPLDNNINLPYRKLNLEYAEYEWQWYLKGDRSVSEIKKRAKIWDSMHNGDDLVWSNYGYQWQRNNQIDKIIELLKKDNTTRKAVISIYDGKEIDNYSFDTPCTLSIHFQIFGEKLCMTVNMRSNDLVFGFCNDQYCFSKLQELITKEINKDIGWYFHFSSNLHIYDRHYNLLK